MRILLTGDNHLDFATGKGTLKKFFTDVKEAMPDIIINLGDMTNGTLHNGYIGLNRLLNGSSTFYVLGNHDLYNPRGKRLLTPDESFANTIKRMSKFSARPLEKSFIDEETTIELPEHECIIVGTIGFPDFNHPKFIMPKEYYNKTFPTNDGTYMDLSKGWLFYTNKILHSFSMRLEKAISTKFKNVIIATHYPIFEGQCIISGDNISPYFFCHEAGHMVKLAAKMNPNKNFWCFSGHSHNYCRGKMSIESDNVVSYGLQADYGRLTCALVDTKMGFEEEPQVSWSKEEPRWASSYHGPIILTREAE